MTHIDTRKSVDDANIRFFSDNDRYAQSVSSLQTYRNIRMSLTAALSDAGRLLDIGNGGVFDYDTAVANEIVALDLFLDESAQARYPPHVHLVRGDATALPSDLGDFDTVAMVMLIHHLVGRDANAVVRHTREMLTAAAGALRPHGRLVIIESVVGRGFYSFERLMWPIAYRALTRRSGGHPPALQLPTDVLLELVTERFVVERFESVPVGRLLLQFGRRFPSSLSPARPILVVAERRDA